MPNISKIVLFPALAICVGAVWTYIRVLDLLLAIELYDQHKR